MLMKNDMKERLYQRGPEVLTNAELIALILRKGKKRFSPVQPKALRLKTGSIGNWLSVTVLMISCTITP